MLTRAAVSLDMRMLRLNTLIWSEAGGKLGQAEASVVHIRLINKCEHAGEQNGVSMKKHSIQRCTSR